MIVAVTMVKDEADVIGTVLSHLLAEGVDHLVVADNLSSDGTREILEGFGDRITVVDDPVIAYTQSVKMSRLAAQAADMGATWVLPFDADEIWYSPSGTIAEALALTEANIVRAPGWDHIVTAEHPGPFSPMRRAKTQQLAKVAFRPYPGAVVHMGNHDVERPGPSTAGPLAFRHHQYRSLEQMTRKLRAGRIAYESSDIHPMHGTHWRAGGLKTDAELAADWAALCAEDGLIFDPPPIRVPVG